VGKPHATGACRLNSILGLTQSMTEKLVLAACANPWLALIGRCKESIMHGIDLPPMQHSLQKTCMSLSTSKDRHQLPLRILLKPRGSIK